MAEEKVVETAGGEVKVVVENTTPPAPAPIPEPPPYAPRPNGG